MELDTITGYVQTELTGNIKESRLIRKEQIEIKQNFHKKNPKSIQYYENLKKDNLMAKEDTVELIEKRTEYSEDNENNFKPKLKNQLQLMFNSLEKTFKKEGIFFYSNKQFNKLYVYKDYNVPVYLLKNKKHTLGLRCEIGQWGDFLNTVSAAPQDYSALLMKFNQWLQSSIQKFDAEESANQFFDKYLLNNPSIDEKIKPQLNKLEELLLKNLRKPGKQPQGFIKKGESVYYSWLEQAQEIHHVEQIETKLNLKSYEQTFDLARRMNRKFSIFIGPTNSGKTYAALNELTKARDGVYLAPLRLMAAEGQEALFERGIITSLITGEEQKIIDEATHISSTIEMCNLNKVIDVAVIDEIQMISDKSRGWAWSQALIGLPAKDIVLVGSQEALPFIQLSKILMKNMKLKHLKERHHFIIEIHSGS